MKKVKSEKSNMQAAQRRKDMAKSGSIYLFRIAAVLLAVVSWWSTAQGMADYVFETGWQAKLASLAIQSILLGMSFYILFLLKHFERKRGKVGMVCLTIVVLLCSSWFSYVYIAGKAYDQAWDTDSQILVQSTYRAELYSASDYAEIYEKNLRDSLTEQVSRLYLQAKQLESTGVQISETLDLDGDRANYGDNDDFAAHNEIAAAIKAMEAAMAEDVSDNILQEATQTVSAMAAQVDTRIENLNEQIEEANDAVDTASDNLQQARNNWENAPADSDTAALQNAYDNAQNNYDTQSAYATSLQAELRDYQTAQSLLQLYQTYLGLASGSTGNQAAVLLRSIQSELLQGDVDVESIETQAVEVFDYLQADESSAEGDTAAYQTLLIDVDGFIRDVQDYSTLKAARQTLDALIESLADETGGAENTDADVEENVTDAEDADADTDTDADTATDTSALSEGVWKTAWASRLNELKAVIGVLPIYTGDDSQLAAYSRTASMDQLDEMLRRYISDHNSVEQAMIYLSSPYRGVAIFSCIIALMLDVVAFVTGFAIQAYDEWQEKKARSEKPGEESSDDEDEEESGLYSRGESVTPPTARSYVYLTGNFSKENGRYCYQALEGAYLRDLELPEQDLPAGFYLQDNKTVSRPVPQELVLYGMAGAPRDGVYQNCSFQYHDHILLLKRQEEREFKFLVTVGEETPIYYIPMHKNECICAFVKDMPQRQWDMAIFALNNKGTQVAAIYLM